jgi:hypothetical protein
MQNYTGKPAIIAAADGIQVRCGELLVYFIGKLNPAPGGLTLRYLFC